jgi:hypothetical protein
LKPSCQRALAPRSTKTYLQGKPPVVIWQAQLEALGIQHSPISGQRYASVLVSRDPDNIQLEFFANPGTQAIQT